MQVLERASYCCQIYSGLKRGAHLFLAHSGLKCTVKQMEPPRYIFAVFPSRDGILISGAVAGYVAGISNSKSNSYFMSSCTYQHLPDQKVPSLLEVIVNQSESVPLLIWIYLMRACNSCDQEKFQPRPQESGRR